MYPLGLFQKGPYLAYFLMVAKSSGDKAVTFFCKKPPVKGALVDAVTAVTAVTACFW